MPFTKGHTLWKHPNCKKSQFKSGTSVRVGMKHRDESKLKVSESRKGKATGANNPSWKGGVTKLLTKIKRLTEYKTWQRRVFERDNYTCRACFQRGGLNLTAHHLSSFSYITRMLGIKEVNHARDEMMLWNIRNGVTLCQECHKDTPNYSWRANKTPRDRTIYRAVVLGLLLLAFVLPAHTEAATFGYTSAGASNHFIARRGLGGGDRLAFTAFSSTEAGTLVSASAYLNTSMPTDISTGDVRYRIFEKDSEAADSHGLIADVYGTSVSVTTAGGWVTQNLASEAVAASDYILSAIGDGFPGSNLNNSTNINIFYDTSTVFSGYDTAYLIEDVIDPLNEADAANNNYSIYATYTASGGGGGGGESTVAQDIFWFD